MRVGQKVSVTVTVTEVDLPRKRIALSMKAKPELGARTERGGNRNEAGPQDLKRWSDQTPGKAPPPDPVKLTGSPTP